VLPALFLLGVFTVARLVETGLESMHYLAGIAHIRAFYRGLGPGAAQLFSAERGRWPEIKSPAERLGSVLALLRHHGDDDRGHQQSSSPAPVSALLVHFLAPATPRWLHVGAGVAVALALTAAFYAYQHWRFSEVEAGAPDDD
jgi:hypothetical protein